MDLGPLFRWQEGDRDDPVGLIELEGMIEEAEEGKLLLAVSRLEGANIAGRERWEGIVLSVTETAEVFRVMSDAADDAVERTAGHPSARSARC